MIAETTLFDVTEYNADGFPSRKYNVIYADPPWSYKDKAAAGKRGVEFKYPTMTIEDIKALPVAEIAENDAVLFLWVTFPLLEEGLATMRAWGFKYKTLGFVWIKLIKRWDKLVLRIADAVLKLGDKHLGAQQIWAALSMLVFLGMGNWTRSNAEICLMGVRGKPKRVDGGIRSVVLAPIREHSQKPDEVRERIVQLMGEVPRIELFARTSTPGWSVWGNEVDKYGE